MTKLDTAACLVLSAVLVVMLATFPDYAITNDEEVQNTYGKLLVAFYRSGFQDLSAFSYINLYLYGGLFDLAAVLVMPWSPWGEYETRHLLCAVIGWIGLVGTWQLGRRVGGPAVGLIALILLAVTGAWYGAQFNNTKDIPFAAAMVWSLFFLVRIAQAWPHPTVAVGLGFGVAFGCALGLRVGAVIAALPALFGLAICLAGQTARLGPAAAVRALPAALGPLVPGLILAVGLMALFWPWSVMGPTHVLDALTTFSRMPSPVSTILDGRPMMSAEVPRYYLPLYLLVKLPEPFLLGLAAALGLVGVGALRRWRSIPRPAVVGAPPAWLPLGMVAVAAVVPILLAVLTRPHLYNGIRHFLFVLPPLAVLAGWGLTGMIRIGMMHIPAAGWRIGFGRAAALGGLGLLVLGLVDLIRLHPHQGVAYNRLVGGVAGAEGRWEMDFWANSLPELAAQLTAYLRPAWERDPQRRWRAAVCAEPAQAAAVLPPFVILERAAWHEADFYLTTNQVGCVDLLDGPVLLRVTRAGAVLGMVKDRR